MPLAAEVLMLAKAILLLGCALAVAVAVLGLRVVRETARRERLRSEWDRYAQGVEAMTSPMPSRRIEGIGTLEDVALRTPDYRDRVRSTLRIFVAHSNDSEDVLRVARMACERLREADG